MPDLRITLAVSIALVIALAGCKPSEETNQADREYALSIEQLSDKDPEVRRKAWGWPSTGGCRGCGPCAGESVRRGAAEFDAMM